MTAAVMEAPSVDRSTLRLSEVARHVVIPAGIERSLWLGWDGQPGVEQRVSELGIRFDRWQDGLAQAELGVTAEGRFAATVGGITLSIPRQVAKTFMTMVIVVALCTMFPNLTVLWTAHRARLSTQTFGKMKNLVLSKRVRRHLRPGRNRGIRNTNGEQEIRFRNGSRIMFGAREHGFGLGFDEVDIEVFDEAQRVTSQALDDMVAATNQSRWEYGALLFFMGTPPRPTDNGLEFTNRRRKALAIKKRAKVGDFGGVVQGGNALYVECSADPDVGKKDGPKLDDRAQVEKANPSYPHRTPDISIQRLRENLTNDDSWRREGLGVWDEFFRESIFPNWNDLRTDAPAPPVEALGIMASFDRVWLSLASYGGGHLAANVKMPYVAGREAFVDYVARVALERNLPVAVQEKTGAALLAPALEERGVHVELVPFAGMVVACDDLDEAITQKTVTHGDYDALNAAVGMASWANVGKQRVIDSKAGDVSMVEAAALARHVVMAGLAADYDLDESVL
ncbi:hypothetical protein [Promicromonospora sp. NPDC050880]|uniref:hypothetical protein n=1 Tax=Promicromonospora sp. NPDC050880 TaxID=3364406 RepID=UPI0037931DBD